MTVTNKKGNGILYFIIVVLVLALGACVFFMMKKGEPAPASGGTDFSEEGKAVLVDASKPESSESVLGLDNGEPEKEKDPAGSVLEATAEVVNAPTEKKEDDSNQLSSVAQKMIEGICEYFGAASPEQRLEHVLHPEIVGPKMKEYYARVPMRAGKVTQIDMPSGMALGGLAYWRAKGQLEDGSPFFVALRMVDGKPKIDWESEVRYSDFDWDEWVDNPAAKDGEFRVYAKIDAVYEAPFSDNERYRCLHLRAMDSARTIFAYLDMNDFDQKEFFNTLTSANGGPLECVLNLEKTKVKDAKIPTAKVLKVISPSWINPRTQDD